MDRVKGEGRGEQEVNLEEAKGADHIHPCRHCKEPRFCSHGKVSYQEFEQKTDMIQL